MRGNKIMGVLWLIIAVCLTLLLLTKMKRSNSWKDSGLMISFNGKSGDNGKSGNSEFLYDSFEFSESEIKNIDVNLLSESVSVETTTDSNIIVELYCTKETAPKVQKIQNVLKIENAPENKVFNLSFEKRKVVIKLPAKFTANEIEISTASGSIHCDGVNSSVLDFNSASGSIHLENCKIDNADCKSASGSIHISESTIKELDCSSKSGSVHLSGTIEKADVHSISGSINANLYETLKSNSKFQSTSGSINLNVPNNSDMDIIYSTGSGTYRNSISGQTGKKGSDKIGNNGPTIELKSTSGSIRIQ